MTLPDTFTGVDIVIAFLSGGVLFWLCAWWSSGQTPPDGGPYIRERDDDR